MAALVSSPPENAMPTRSPAGNVSRILDIVFSPIIVGRKHMLIVHVHVRVKPQNVEAFRQASVDNARNSVQEPGIARFDVIQQQDDPTRFILVEVYRDQAATVKHKETGHYAAWRDTVADMMAEPRSSVKFSNIFPEDEGW